MTCSRVVNQSVDHFQSCQLKFSEFNMAKTCLTRNQFREITSHHHRFFPFPSFLCFLFPIPFPICLLQFSTFYCYFPALSLFHLIFFNVKNACHKILLSHIRGEENLTKFGQIPLTASAQPATPTLNVPRGY